MSVQTIDSSARSRARAIEAIYAPPPIHWVGDGFRVMGYFAQDAELVRKLSPFVLIDYHAPFDYPPSANMRRGVGPHPHRGFETVTVAFDGSVAHHDSTGAGGIIGPGDVQWMTAGAGILHKEYHEQRFARAGGRLHLMQIWVNLPAALKMTQPGYQHLERGAIAVVALPDDGGSVRVIAGRYAGVAGAARTFTPIDMLEVRLRAKGCFDLDLPAHHNTAILVMDGDVTINGERTAHANDLVLFGHAGNKIAIESAAGDAHLLVLSGEPIDEPVAQYGPFVMNTEAELRTAVSDYNCGLFGRLAD
jgi:redox-sensitive bicupin YhaK (pirin superfamily)